MSNDHNISTTNMYNAVHGLVANALKSTDQHPMNTPSIKSLDAEFSSFGEAIHTYMNSQGYGDSNKDIDSNLTKAFCRALGLPYATFDTDNLVSSREFFPTTDWVTEYLTQHEYIDLGKGIYVRLDEGNRPVSLIQIKSSNSNNIEITYVGESAQAELLYQLCKENVVVDVTPEAAKPVHYVSFDGFDREGDPDYDLKRMQRQGELAQEYYPYVVGGVSQLLADFLNSDESVLILMGPPGTGKSSALMYAVDDLNLLPIYTTKQNVLQHPDFVSKLFHISDYYLEHHETSTVNKRKGQFTETNLADNITRFTKKFNPISDGSGEQDIKNRIPIAVIEDADFLLAPRIDGNSIMGQLLNEVDGVGSNHARKLVFTTNLSNMADIEPALLRDGRCFGVFDFRKLTPSEAIAARRVAGLPEFETVPTTDVPLATALRKPRKRYIVESGQVKFGFGK